MEQALINEGIPVEEISRLCDVHAAVFRDAPVSDSPERIFTGPRTIIGRNVRNCHPQVASMWWKIESAASVRARGMYLTFGLRWAASTCI